MSVSIRSSPKGRRAMTLVELLVVTSVFGILALLLARAFSSTSIFYRSISQESRQTGGATVVLDRIQGLCFGLPIQAFTLTRSGDSDLLVVHPLEKLAPTGGAVYSTYRVVLESRADGVYWWEVPDQNRTLGSALVDFPPPPGQQRVRRVLGPGWKLKAGFSDGHFPLQLELTSPGPGERRYGRTVPGYL